MSNDAHERGLERLDFTALGEQLLQIFVDSRVFRLQLLSLVLGALQRLVKLGDLAIGELEFFLGPFDVSQNVVVRLVSALD